MKERQNKLKIGDSVVTKPGVKDPDTGGDLSGWQGRITNLQTYENEMIVDILWDGITLKNIPISMIGKCKMDGLDWSTMSLDEGHVESVAARDTEKDVEDALEEIDKQTYWLDLDEEGVRIQKVLDGIATDNEMELVKAWEKHLHKKLSFPFETEIVEGEHFGRLRVGHRINVKSISDADAHYGILVMVQKDKERYTFPLCDLEVTNQNSPNYQIVRDYVIWFANR